MDTARRAPRIGLWGAFDVEDLGAALFARITRAELTRRLPDAEIRVYAPFGRERPNAFDGEEPGEPLGEHRPERLAELAASLDAIIVGGEVPSRDDALASLYGVEPDVVVPRAPSRFLVDGLGEAAERRCPLLWHAVGIASDLEPENAERYRRALAGRRYVSVGDEISRLRLERAGVDREIEVVPDPAVLLTRAFPPSDLERRLEQLRILGWLPDEGPALVVQGSAAMVEQVDHLAPGIEKLAEARGAHVVLLEVSPASGDAEFAAAMEDRLGDRARRAEGATVEDVVAAIAGSAGFVGGSVHGNLVAFLYGRPHAVLTAGDDPASAEFADMLERPEAVVPEPAVVADAFERVAAIGVRPDLVRALQRRADEHFDRLAEEVGTAFARREAGPQRDGDEATELRRQLDGTWAGYTALARRAAAERGVHGKHLEEIERRRQREADGLEQGIRDRDAEIEALRRTLEAERERLEGEVADREAQIQALLNTRTYRYTASLRRLWGRIRGVGRR